MKKPNVNDKIWVVVMGNGKFIADETCYLGESTDDFFGDYFLEQSEAQEKADKLNSMR